MSSRGLKTLDFERREGQRSRAEPSKQGTSRVGTPVSGDTSSGSMVERNALIGLRDGECAWALDDGPIPRIVPLARWEVDIPARRVGSAVEDGRDERVVEPHILIIRAGGHLGGP